MTHFAVQNPERMTAVTSTLWTRRHKLCDEIKPIAMPRRGGNVIYDISRKGAMV